MPTTRKIAGLCAALLLAGCTRVRSDSAAAPLASSARASAPDADHPATDSSVANAPEQTPPSEEEQPACPDDDSASVGLGRAAFEGDLANVRSLLAHAAPDERSDACHPTPLMQALSPFIAEPNARARVEEARAKRKLAIANLLLDAGANVKLAGRHRMTVLHYAASAYFPEDASRDLVKRVLALGADVDLNARTDGGQTPLSMAIHRGRPAIVRVLLEAGADPSKAASGELPLALAERLGAEEIAGLLREFAKDAN